MKSTRMKRFSAWLCALFAVAALTTTGWAQETGRTDGPEESEYGKGGNPFGSRASRGYITGSFGSGFFDTAGPRSTGFLFGVEAGYEMDEWVALQGGFNRVQDDAGDMNIVGLGAIFSYPSYMLVYSAGLHASLYDPEVGESNFGIAPGVGVDVVLSDRVRVGLNWRHDYIFTDSQTTEMDRVYAGIKFFF